MLPLMDPPKLTCLRTSYRSSKTKRGRSYLTRCNHGVFVLHGAMPLTDATEKGYLRDMVLTHP